MIYRKMFKTEMLNFFMRPDSRLLLFILGFALGSVVFGFLLPAIFPSAILPVFSPEEGETIIEFIDGAEETLEIEVYILSSRDVIEALERAKNRGVNIRIIIEERTIGTKNTEIYAELVSKGFQVKYASPVFALTHSKFMIADGKRVIVGSHNFSNSAITKNREASVIFEYPPAVAEFIEIFEHDWALAH